MQIVGKFWEIFKRFSIILLRKLPKMHSFTILLKKFKKACVIVSRIWTKNANIFRKFWDNFENFWWKFNEKFSFLFYFYFRKFVPKNRAFGNKIIFLQQFFRFRGDFPLSPWRCPCLWQCQSKQLSYFFSALHLW